MKKRKNPIYQYVVLAIFIALTFAPGILWAFLGSTIGESSNEKRKLAQMPTLDIIKITNFPKQFDNYFNDHAPFRKPVGEIWAHLNYHVFKDSTSSSVIVGKTADGPKNAWLFFDSDNDVKPIIDAQDRKSVV